AGRARRLGRGVGRHGSGSAPSGPRKAVAPAGPGRYRTLTVSVPLQRRLRVLPRDPPGPAPPSAGAEVPGRWMCRAVAVPGKPWPCRVASDDSPLTGTAPVQRPPAALRSPRKSHAARLPRALQLPSSGKCRVPWGAPCSLGGCEATQCLAQRSRYARTPQPHPSVTGSGLFSCRCFCL
ncbi:hypothetical protein DV515_00015923, partial [Chloebia gouldiae]